MVKAVRIDMSEGVASTRNTIDLPCDGGIGASGKSRLELLAGGDIDGNYRG